jgi:hypothetical protein
MAATLGFARPPASGTFAVSDKGNRKSSDLRLDTNDVRFIFPPPETVLSIGHRLDGAGDGVLVWLCRQSHRVDCARRCRRGDILVGTVALVRPLFCPLRRNLRRRLDGVGAASLGAVVHPRFRADPVHLLFSGPGQRRHQQLVTGHSTISSRPRFRNRSRSRSSSSTANCRPSPASPWSRSWLE